AGGGRVILPADRLGVESDGGDGPLARLQGPTEIAENPGSLGGTGEAVNCEMVHRRLLTLEEPERLPADLNDHLAVCAACRSWHEHLVAVEREVPFLPVPPPERRTSFLRTLSEKLPARSRPRLFRPSLNGQRERGQRKVAIAVALAASLLVLALGAWL